MAIKSMSGIRGSSQQGEGRGRGKADVTREEEKEAAKEGVEHVLRAREKGGQQYTVVPVRAVEEREQQDCGGGKEKRWEEEK